MLVCLKYAEYTEYDENGYHADRRQERGKNGGNVQAVTGQSRQYPNGNQYDPIGKEKLFCGLPGVYRFASFYASVCAQQGPAPYNDAIYHDAQQQQPAEHRHEFALPHCTPPYL